MKEIAFPTLGNGVNLGNMNSSMYPAVLHPDRIWRYWLRLGGLIWLGMLVAGIVQATEPIVKKFQVQLVWGTDSDQAPGDKVKALGPRLNAKLTRIFRWKHYWEVCRHDMQVKFGHPAFLKLKGGRTLAIEFISPTEREIRLYQKYHVVRTSRRAISDSGMTIHGWEAEKDQCWFVVIRELKPENP